MVLEKSAFIKSTVRTIEYVARFVILKGTKVRAIPIVVKLFL